MIGFTLWYARPIAAAIDPGNGASLPRAIVLLIGCHMSIQSAFTVAIHVRELERMQMPANFRFTAMGILLGAAIAAGIVTKYDLRDLLSVDGGEAGYWLFMGLYTVLVPAYVWLFMLRREPIKHAVAIMAALFVVCAALLWIGFIHRQMYLLLPAMLIVIGSRWVIPRRV